MKEEREKRKKIIMDIMSTGEYRPLKLKEFSILLGLKGDEITELEEVLNELTDENRIIKTAKNKYILSDDDNRILGNFISHNKGFGFVEVEGQDEDIFIPADFTKGAMHGDTVIVTIKSQAESDRRREGEVVRIVRRGISSVIGTFEKSQNFGFVIVDHKKFNKDIFIPTSKNKGAMSGHKVVVKITDYGSLEKNPEGEIIEIIGHINDPETEIKAIIMAYDIPMVFPEEVLEETEKINLVITPEEYEKEKHREDWREVLTVTIDGEDAKDLDDAISIRRLGNNYELGVHIADVTHYVKENSPLDKEALLRGTSTYLVDRVIPMLPHRLSNGICSLNAKEDRFALSCIMEIDRSGKVIKHRIIETLICVDERMNYSDVKKILVDHDEELMKRYAGQVDMFLLMEELQSVLKEKRKKRGSIDFDFPEAKFILDENKKIKEIKPYERNIATKIIEEFMLLANETVAEEFHWQEIPFLYRSHDDPDPDKIRVLSEFIHNFGYTLKGKGKNKEPHPKEIQKLLYEIEGKDEEMIISRLALRSMKQAKYTVTSNGHFGLAAEYYTHFTSPIRRYPDLQIHRIIKDVIRGRLSERRFEHYESILEKVAFATSRLERRAEEAEREVMKYKKAEYMENRIGQIFTGVVSGLTNWGIYVELSNTIEGLIPISKLFDDYYHYDEKQLFLIGERNGRIFRLGDRLSVEVVSVDKKMRTIDFGLSYDQFEEE
ncbi:MAG: ribonuclease R [Vallitaleaceae bacterium]|nr:ribonuclease R [Vallitaleaceae bacterium]